jgi:GAG-pre-integrase domain
MTPNRLEAGQHFGGSPRRRQVHRVTPQNPEIFMATINLSDKDEIETPYPLGATSLVGLFTGQWGNRSIVWDTGASVSLTYDSKDFVGEITTPPDNMQIKGITENAKVEGVGLVEWEIPTANGGTRLIKIRALYVPTARQRLLSISDLLKHSPGETLTVNEEMAILSGIEGDATRGRIEAKVQDNNVPMTYAKALMCTTSPKNKNLTEPEKELNRWHNRLGHVSYQKIQYVLATGALAVSETKRSIQAAACRIREALTCEACQYGKQTVKSPPQTTEKKPSEARGGLTKDVAFPGQVTSVDHFISSVPGRTFTGTGNAVNKSDNLNGGALFVDHFSGHVHVEFQHHLTTSETLTAKDNYEAMCRENGIYPQTYQSDNGSQFTSADYTKP